MDKTSQVSLLGMPHGNNRIPLSSHLHALCVGVDTANLHVDFQTMRDLPRFVAFDLSFRSD